MKNHHAVSQNPWVQVLIPSAVFFVIVAFVVALAWPAMAQENQAGPVVSPSGSTESGHHKSVSQTGNQPANGFGSGH